MILKNLMNDKAADPSDTVTEMLVVSRSMITDPRPTIIRVENII